MVSKLLKIVIIKRPTCLSSKHPQKSCKISFSKKYCDFVTKAIEPIDLFKFPRFIKKIIHLFCLACYLWNCTVFYVHWPSQGPATQFDILSLQFWKLHQVLERIPLDPAGRSDSLYSTVTATAVTATAVTATAQLTSYSTVNYVAVWWRENRQIV